MSLHPKGEFGAYLGLSPTTSLPVTWLYKHDETAEESAVRRAVLLAAIEFRANGGFTAADVPARPRLLYREGESGDLATKHAIWLKMCLWYLYDAEQARN